MSKMLNKKSKRDNKELEKVPEQKIKKEVSSFYKDEIDEPEVIDNKKPSQKESSTSWINKQRTLVVASRGVSHQARHLVNDVISLLPHSKKECKIEKNVAKDELGEILYNHNCKSCLYFEHRKRELVLWMFRQDGPCVKFQVRNIHTLTEIKLFGNCLKYSRPFLSFDKTFDEVPHLKLLKQMFTHSFNSPKNHPKSKPFYDHMICFYNVNNHIFFRNYQILNELKEKFIDTDDAEKLQLVEIGPRFSLNIIRIFDGPLGGKTIFSNPNYTPPGLLMRRNADEFKLRRFKEEKEKEDLQDRLNILQDEKHMWLEN